ncbi:MAG: transcriptional regulator NrdR [Verrucomicrobia bacterium]|nr:transcriptional regulator NrdR [Verrucomicrobiota bacterium]
MRCPKCGYLDDKVVDSRSSREGSIIRRRRECLDCGYRYTTYEEIEHQGLMVVKSDGRREEFSRDKLIAGIRRACEKRPISPQTIEDLVAKVIGEFTTEHEREVPCSKIGERIMSELRQLDQVAYVRFASVYRRFKEATDFVQEVQRLEVKP